MSTETQDPLETGTPTRQDLPLLADLSDEELVTAHPSGRLGAFKGLHDRYDARLGHFIRRRTGSTAGGWLGGWWSAVSNGSPADRDR